MAEGGLFYAAMFTVVAGLGLIFGLGIVSFFNPYRVQVCHEHKKIDHGVLNFGLGYNGTILDGSVVTFRCYTGYELQGPEKKVCDEEQGYLLRGGWVPKEKVNCVKSECSQCYANVSAHLCVLLALWTQSVSY